MRRILASHGVPPALAHLPLVESSYRTVAHSHAGAVGVWQFTRSTGRRFLHIDHAVDERLDTLLATEAAAKYLRENYDRLGTWPLAITAYNHGANGMAYAVRRLGTTNLATIVEQYKSPQFGFASRNFYAEFLAANEVMSQSERYCGPTRRPAIVRDTVVVPDYVSFAEIARSANTDPESLAVVNPALARDVINGRLRVPKGYRLTLPADRTTDAFLLAYATLPSSTKSSTQARYYATHRVERGQTLSGIATQYRTSVAAIERHNHIADPRRLRTGQVLNIPIAASAPVAQPSASASAQARRDDGEVRLSSQPSVADGYRTHRVSRGQTLTHIARIYRTTVSLLQRHNGISDPRKLRNGQVLKIPR
jgi:membrane-bound lytic murein transglycosylase D